LLLLLLMMKERIDGKAPGLYTVLMGVFSSHVMM